MINAKDLRIDNWIKYDNILVQVYAIQDSMISYRNHHYSGVSFFEPIPLTPEILLKCGFKPSWGNEYKLYLEDCYLVSDGEEVWVAKEFNDLEYTFSKGVGSLHLLQNLYNSLTQTELIYKP